LRGGWQELSVDGSARGHRSAYLAGSESGVAKAAASGPAGVAEQTSTVNGVTSVPKPTLNCPMGQIAPVPRVPRRRSPTNTGVAGRYRHKYYLTSAISAGHASSGAAVHRHRLVRPYCNPMWASAAVLVQRMPALTGHDLSMA
jgi:hypothetical protein